MSQHDRVIDNASGVTVRTDINAALAAIFSSSSGPVAPATTVAGQLWLDTSTAGVTKLNIRDINNTTWIVVATGSSVLALAGGTMTGDLVLYGGAPATAASAAPKSYVDNVAAGLDVKQSCIVASTANLGLTGLAAIDGVTPIAGDRILVKNQTTTSANGIYVAASGAWARATDMDNWGEVPGAHTFVERGTVGADTSYVCTSDQGGTLGTTAITWAIFGGSGAFQASSAVLTSLATLTTGDGAVRLNTGTASLLTLLTAAQFLANTAGGVLQADSVWSAAVPTALTDAASIAVNMNLGSNFSVTLNVAGSTRVLANPTNPKVGQCGWIEVTQDGTGNRAMTFGTNYKWAGGSAGAGILSVAASAVDMIFYTVRSGTDIRLSMTNAWA